LAAGKTPSNNCLFINSCKVAHDMIRWCWFILSGVSIFFFLLISITKQIHEMAIKQLKYMKLAGATTRDVSKQIVSA
jgi:hypothetical protein